MDKLEKEIEELYNKKLLKQRIEVHLRNIQKRLRSRYQELKHWEIVLEQDKSDVEELAKLSLRSLFHQVLGNKEEQLERSRQNYLLSFLNYHDCKKRVAAKKYEIEVLIEKLKSFDEVDIKLAKLVETKRSHLKFKNRTAAKKIMKLEEKIREIINKQKEINEAILSGKRAWVKIEEFHDILNEMKSWQLAARGNRYSAIVPFYDQKQFVKAKISEIEEVKNALFEFMEEMDDLTVQYKLDYSRLISRLHSFFERFYDGLISDWIFHKELMISINITFEAIDKIKRILEMLEKDLKNAMEEEKTEKDILQSLIIVLDIK